MRRDVYKRQNSCFFLVINPSVQYGTKWVSERSVWMLRSDALLRYSFFYRGDNDYRNSSVSSVSYTHLDVYKRQLSAISALIALVPFYYIWKVMQEVLAVAPDFSHAQNLTRNGWMAVLFAVIAVLVYIGALMC